MYICEYEILVDFNLAVVFNSPPNLLAIRYQIWLLGNGQQIAIHGQKV